MQCSWLLCGAATGALMAGCTFAPNVDMTYVMPKARTVVTVTQTIGCSSANYILSVADGQITTNYVPDYDGPRGTINFQAPDNWFVDTDTAVTLTDDGRLASINSTNTGEAGAVVKSLVALAGTLLRAEVVPVAKPNFCARLALFATPKAPAGGQTTPKPAPTPAHSPALAPAPSPAPAQGQTQAPVVTLTYANQFDFQQTGDQITVIDQSGNSEVLKRPDDGGAPTADLDVPPDINSSPIVAALNQALKTDALTHHLVLKTPTLTFSVTVSPAANVPQQPTPVTTPSDKNVVKVPKLNVINFVLSGPVGDLSKIAPSTTSQAVIPTRDSVLIPLGESEPFGKISTTLTVAGSGLVNKLEYNKGSGAADLLTAANQIAAQALPPPQTAEQKAAEIQGQSDLIYQQRRLITCQATPAQCPSK